MEPGIYLQSKPPGVTSFELVRNFTAEARSHAGRKLPICHGGALDPFAEGLLLLLAGSATKLMELMHPIPKRYVAEVSWGAETDNGDPLGRVVQQSDASRLSPKMLDDALARFIGWHEQVPPAFSNKRVEGERAYLKAHRGESVELPPSRVYLHEAHWISHELPRKSTLELSCRGGYYVRSLARDLGRTLGCFAHLSALKRTAIGPWQTPTGSEAVLVPREQVLSWCRSRTLTDHELGALRKGESIDIGELRSPTWALPKNFPDPEAPIRGEHLQHLAALLREHEGKLRLQTELRGL